MNILLVAENAAAAEQIKTAVAGQFEQSEIVACSPGLAVLDITRTFSPDFAIIQAGIQSSACLGIIQHLKKLDKPVYILFIAGAEDFAVLEQAQEAGADDFMAGTSSGPELALRVKKAALAGGNTRSRHNTRKTRSARQSGQKAKSPLAAVAGVCGNVLFGALLALMAVLAFFLVQSKFAGGVPSVFGYQMYVVLSGSMSPAFDTGSLAFVRPADPETIEVGDIITFGSSEGSMLTTHRVVDRYEQDGLKFTTRGDANNVDDPNPVPAENIIGRVHGSVPYLGYLMGFAQTRQGLIFLVFIPGILVIVFELSNIFKYMREMDKDPQAARGRRGKRGRGRKGSPSAQAAGGEEQFTPQV